LKNKAYIFEIKRWNFMIYVFLADGFEDAEAIVPRDILKRAKFNIQTVGVENEFIVSALNLTVKTDIQIENATTQNLEAIVLPGGMPGTENLCKNQKVHEIIKYCVENEILIGAICAAPMILGELGYLKGKKVCCFPGIEKYLTGADVLNDKVCADGNFITAKGPGAAFEFAFALVEYLRSNAAAEKIKKSVQYS
jgi:4-methyl-5(b-hydroxyethyl)-thiazole monophosphate biosynthesis